MVSIPIPKDPNKRPYQPEVVVSGASGKEFWTYLVTNFKLVESVFSFGIQAPGIVSTLSVPSGFYPRFQEEHYLVNNTSSVTLKVSIVNVFTPSGGSAITHVSRDFYCSPNTVTKAVLSPPNILEETRIEFSVSSTPSGVATIGFGMFLV